MPAVAIKISEDFATLARAEAEQADRSLTGQVEHWGKIGRVVESVLPAHLIAMIKRQSGDPQPLAMASDLRFEIQAAFEAFLGLSADRRASLMGLDQQTRFEPDPESPGGLIRISPDGVRTRGTIQDRVFIPKA